MTGQMKKSDAFQRYFLYFFLYCVIGWCYEVFLEVVVYRWGFSNRGVLFGPYLPVYGVGALVFLFLLYPLLRGKPWKRRLLLLPVIFFGCGLTATLIELIASYLCELMMGSWPWQTYARDYTIQFQGRIALSPSIRFGLGGVVFLYLVQPLFERLVGSLRPNVRTLVFGICLGVMVLDVLVFFIKTIL